MNSLIGICLSSRLLRNTVKKQRRISMASAVPIYKKSQSGSLTDAIGMIHMVDVGASNRRFFLPVKNCRQCLARASRVSNR